MSQPDLFTINSLKNVGNSEPPLLTMVEQLRNKQILIPDFQRDPDVWIQNKVKEWIKSVIYQTAIGVIVTYQLEGGSPLFLADGLQRLTSTMRFLEDPSNYGFNFGIEQAEQFCRNFSVTVQHRHYPNHWEAMKAFHNLNRGTPLTPAEYFKGDLCLDTRGEIVNVEIPKILEKYEVNLVPSRTPPRNQRSTLLRDCYALFFQYISKSKTTSFWSVSSSNVDKGTPIERRLVKFFGENKYNVQDVKSSIQKFDNYLAGQFRQIHKLKQEIGKHDQPVNRTTTRWLLHLALWQKNNRLSGTKREAFVKALLQEASVHPTFGSRSIKIEKYGSSDSVAIKVDNLQPALGDLSKKFNIPLHQSNKRKKGQTIKGDHRSHKKPFSLFGEVKHSTNPDRATYRVGQNLLMISKELYHRLCLQLAGSRSMLPINCLAASVYMAGVNHSSPS